MVIPRYLEARGVPGIVCPTACGFMARTRTSGEPLVYACLLMPRYTCSLYRYMRQQAKARTLITQATAALITRSLLVAAAGMDQNRVLHK